MKKKYQGFLAYVVLCNGKAIASFARSDTAVEFARLRGERWPDNHYTTDVNTNIEGHHAPVC